MPFPLAEYGALKTENGKPLCQNTVPETCHPFSARASSAIPEFDRQLINVLGGEVVPHVVVAGTVLAAKLARQRRENGSGGEWQESAVRDRVHAVAPRVVGLDLNAVPQPLVGR